MGGDPPGSERREVQADTHLSKNGVRENTPELDGEKGEEPTAGLVAPNTVTSRVKNPGPRKGKVKPEPAPPVWAPKGGQAPSGAKKISILLRAVAKGPQKTTGKTPREQTGTGNALKELPGKNYEEEVRSLGGDLAMESTSRSPR